MFTHSILKLGKLSYQALRLPSPSSCRNSVLEPLITVPTVTVLQYLLCILPFWPSLNLPETHRLGDQWLHFFPWRQAFQWRQKNTRKGVLFPSLVATGLERPQATPCAGAEPLQLVSSLIQAILVRWHCFCEVQLDSWVRKGERSFDLVQSLGIFRAAPLLPQSWRCPFSCIISKA